MLAGYPLHGGALIVQHGKRRRTVRLNQETRKMYEAKYWAFHHEKQ